MYFCFLPLRVENLSIVIETNKLVRGGNGMKVRVTAVGKNGVGVPEFLQHFDVEGHVGHLHQN
jgi:hypothetical protein